MATFSPSPAPRRSSRLQNRGGSPVRTQRSRMAQAPAQIINDNSSIVSAMDIDDRSSIMTDRSLSRMGGDMLFSKTDDMSVLFYANLPLEVKQVLRISDFNMDPYSGEIDTVTGFALITSVQTCFVWQHAQAIRGIPTCYIFSCPYDPRSPRPPLHSLVLQGSSREPGLVLVSAAGQVRFWDSIGIGLAGGDNYVSSQLDDVEDDEDVTNLVRANAQTYILSTSYGRLYRLVLTSVGGKYHLTIRNFARPSSTGSFSRLVSFLSATSTPSFEIKDKSKHIHAVSLGRQSQTGDRDVWALANGHIQCWSLKAEGWEEFLSDSDPTFLLAEAIENKFGSKNRNLENFYQDIELSDLAVFDDHNVAILVSYPESDDDEPSHDFRRLYALAELAPSAGGFQVKHLNSVPYQTTSKPGPAVHPRIQLIYSGSIVSVQFGDAVALCARGSEYCDRLELKYGNDRTLGVGVSLSTNLLLILTASTMMKVSLDLEKIQAFRPETGHTNLVKSIMMQAILYGSSPLNPLRFSFPPALNEEALMQAAQQLSEAVLKSDPEVVRHSPDMTVQMTGRKERLSWLIGFINENAALVKMSQGSRQQLATDAEKLYACHQLWLSYNQFLSSSSSQNVLKDAILRYMEEIGDNLHEDVVRVFFRSRITEIGKMLVEILNIMRSTSDVASLLPEANRIVITVLRSTFQYRTYNLKVYGIQLPMSKPWSSRKKIIDTVLSLFELTTKAVEPPPGSSIRGKDTEPSSQLPSLAAVLLESLKEKLDWLTSAGIESQHELELLEQQISTLRPEVLETLSKCGHEDAAFSLAEQYHDYASLVALCHRETIYPPDKNPHVERIQSYIQRYKEDFTTELFQYYVQHGEVRIMFDQEAPGAGYLDVFFKERPNIAISWLQDFGNSHFGSAASALLKDAENATNLEAKHLMLSIGKLSHLAQMQETNLPDESTLDAFHDELDFISVHEALMEEFRCALLSARVPRQSIDGQVDLILQSKGRKLGGKPAFIHIFKDILRYLLAGKALSVEDLVELLTLKDNSETVEDFSTCLHLLSSIKTKKLKNLPAAREDSAIRTVWRRVYLHDDWDVLKQTDDVSDEELNARYQGTALYSTLCILLQRNEICLEPAEVLMIPSTEEIVSRWPGMSSEQVDSVIKDYTSEQDQLGEWELDGIFERIKELAVAGITQRSSQ